MAKALREATLPKSGVFGTTRGGEIWFRKGSSIKGIDIDKLSETDRQNLKGIGVDINNLFKVDPFAFQQLEVMGFNVNKTRNPNEINIKSFRPASKTQETITATQSPINPHGIDVTSSLQGSLSKGKTVEQNLFNAGGTPEAVAGVLQGGQAQPFGGTVTYSGEHSLTDDMTQVVEAVYNAVATNDQNYAEQIQAAMDAASTFSDPYFKSQILLVTDALGRGLKQAEGDLAYREQQLSNSLASLQANASAASSQASFSHQKQMKQLEKQYKVDLENTQNQMAATGFTSSSRRSKAEKLLQEEKQDLIQSSSRSLAYTRGASQRSLSAAQKSTQAEVENLRRLAEAGKIDALRQAEATVGSQALSDLGYTNLLGGISGTVERERAQDALSFSQNFVF